MDFKQDEIPPPSYSQSELADKGPATASATATAPSESTATTASDTMHIYMTDWKGRSLRVMSSADSDPNPATMLYHVELHTTRKPHMIFRRPPPTTTATDHVESNGPALATVKFHSLHTHIDIDMDGREFKLKPKSKLKLTDFEYGSTVLRGDGQAEKLITWTSPTPWVVMESTCLDENKMAVARTVPVEWAKRKAAKIEFAASGLSQAEIDEVVVTGMAFFYYRFLMCVGMTAANS